MDLPNTIKQIREHTWKLETAVNELMAVTERLSPEQMEFLTSNNIEVDLVPEIVRLSSVLQEMKELERKILDARKAAHTVRTRVNPDGTYFWYGYGMNAIVIRG